MYREFYGRCCKDLSELYTGDYVYSPWASFSLTKECNTLRIGDRMFSSIDGDFLKYELNTESIIIAIRGKSWAKTFDIIVPNNRIGRDRVNTEYKKMSIVVYTDSGCIGGFNIDGNHYRAFTK